MKIELLYFPGCAKYQEVEALIEEVVQSEGVPAEVKAVEVKTPEQAKRLGFLGSPTIRVEGVDIEPLAPPVQDFGLKCRIYRDGKRLVGVPPRELIQHAIKRARNGQYYFPHHC